MNLQSTLVCGETLSKPLECENSNGNLHADLEFGLEVSETSPNAEAGRLRLRVFLYGWGILTPALF